MRIVCSVAFILVILVAVAGIAQQPVPVGEELQISLSGGRPDVGQAADGSFVVVWTDYDLSYLGISGRRYDPSGQPVGGVFQVNSYTTLNQRFPTIAMQPGGEFVVVWESEGSSGTDCCDPDAPFSVQAQLFDAKGAAIGLEFQVNSTSAGNQYQSSVAADGSGNFVVAWTDRGPYTYPPDFDAASIRAQRFDVTGTPVGGEFQVNTYTTGTKGLADVTMDTDGDFIVVWSAGGSFGDDDSAGSVQGQRYDASGNPSGTQFQINSYTTLAQQDPGVVADPDGNFIVAWTSNGSAEGDYFLSVQAQRFDATGNPLGNEFQVNTYTTSSQASPDIAIEPGGAFIVTWSSFGSTGSDDDLLSIQGQRFDSSGAPAGVEFQVNTSTTFGQYIPRVASGREGEFVVTWFSFYSNFLFGSQGQRFEVPMPIFADGFESGDTSAWSTVSP